MTVRKANINPIDEILDSTVKAVSKKYGLFRLGDSSEFAQVNQFVSFGHYGLNQITGGGAPAGRLVELYGAFSSGKSLLIAHLLAECQKAGGIAILDDGEHAYLRHFGELIGIDNSRLLYLASETVEDVFDAMEVTIQTILDKNPDQLILYAWDSVAATSCKAEMDTDNNDTSGFNTEKARAITKGTRKMVGMIGKHNVCLVVANQMKKAIGVLYGPQDTTSGGDAIPFWSSIRIKLGKGERITADGKEGGEVIGVSCRAECTKNKIVKPFQKCTFDIIFDEGLVYASGCVDALIKKGVIQPIAAEMKGQIDKVRNTGYYLFKGEKYRKAELNKFFEDNRDNLEAILSDLEIS